MIYVCEYDGFIDAEILQEMSGRLPLTFPEGWQSGRKWEKARQRILAWLLFAYGLDLENHMEDRTVPYSSTERSASGDILQNLAILRDGHGKPYSSTCRDIFFNLSHSDTACACIIGNEPVGIDVERKFPYKAALERSLCHPGEKEVLEMLETEERERQQQVLWSVKESFVKLDGRGLGYGLKNINLSKILPASDGTYVVPLQTDAENKRSCEVICVHEEVAEADSVPCGYSECPLYSGCAWETVAAQKESALLPYVVQIQTGEHYTLAACGRAERAIVKVTEKELKLWINGSAEGK